MSANIRVDFELNHPQWRAWNVIHRIKVFFRLFLGWGRGVGKALALDTPLPTPDGWTTMGEVKVGDRLFDEQGKPCVVTYTTGVMRDRTCFKVVFDDGEEIVADAEHLWFTWDKRARKSHGRQGPGRKPSVHPQIRTTVEIYKSLRADKGREVNHSIPIAGALECETSELPIDPYILGVWLGDGTSSEGYITFGNQDADESVGLLEARGCIVGKPTSVSNGTSSRVVNWGRGKGLSLKERLRDQGLLNNKHIPSEYLRASVGQRQLLLAGLLDSDGHCTKNGQVEFTSTNQRLANSVLELVRTLGFKTGFYTGRASLNGVDQGPKYRVHFTPRSDVFLLSRKNARIVADKGHLTRTSHRYIVDVVPVKSVPVKCITVDSKSHLFLAGRAMVPTHNTWFIRQVWWTLVAEHDGIVRRVGVKKQRGVRIVVLLPTLKQFKDLYWEDIEADLLPGGEWDFLKAKLNKTRGIITFPGGSWIKPFPAAAVSGKRARGLRGDALFVDEADDIEADVYYSVAIPMLSDPCSLGFELVAGTPTRGRHGLWNKLMEAGKLADKLRQGLIPDDVALRHEAAAAVYDLFLNLPEKDWPETLPKDPIQATLTVLKSYHAIHATYKDAPETVTPMSVAHAKSKLDKATFEREYEANPNAGEGLVYQLDEDFHVRMPPELSVFDEFHVGMDFGRNGAMLLTGTTGKAERRTLWFLDEWFEVDCPNHIWDKRAKAWDYAKFWPDTSRTDRCDDLRAMGLRVGETDRGPGSILAGIDRLVDLIHKRKTEVGRYPYTEVHTYSRLYVSPKCVNTIREFGNYRYKKLPDGTFSDTPIKKNDHLMDCGRYIALGVFGRMNVRRHETSGR